MQQGTNRSDSWIEAFEVANLKDALVTLRQADQIVCLLESSCKRFFHQDIHAGSQKLRCYCCMQ